VAPPDILTAVSRACFEPGFSPEASDFALSISLMKTFIFYASFPVLNPFFKMTGTPFDFGGKRGTPMPTLLIAYFWAGMAK